MVLFARLELKQTQRLVITPQLQQAIKLLQLSSLDLQTYVENEIRDNPLLSLQDEAPRESETDFGGGDFAQAGADGAVFDGRDRVADAETAFSTASDGSSETLAAPIEVDTSSADAPDYSDWHLASQTANRTDFSDDYDPLASIAVDISLADHLRAQAYQVFLDVPARFIADFLIDMVDTGGYVRGCLDEAALSLGVSRCDVEQILTTLQTFDPPGVCARSLPECLAIQLKEKCRLDPMMERFIAHLDLVASCDFQRLKKQCGASAEDLDDMLGEIRLLNPRPGSAFETATIETLVPDVIVKRTSDGTWGAELNPASAPAVAVDRAYYQTLKSRCRSEGDRAYLAERMSAANWLAKSLEQRLSTILKVATAIVEEQAAFFDHGVRHLRPLNLRQIAAKIGMHESTVSRVTSNKAMATPRGLLEMKFFFTSSIAAAGSKREAHSSEAVRDRIREMIVNEASDKVLSDDRIVTMLKADGIDIARRTVAKYREALRIPSSAARRRQKRAWAA